ncbi:MAG: 2-hydroxyacid dehydrogenase [Candidatus Njordarchaeota archaeon]
MTEKRIMFVSFYPDDLLKSLIDKELGHLVNIIYPKELTGDIADKVEIILADNGRELEKFADVLQHVKFIQTLSAGLEHVPFDIIPNDVMVSSNSGGNALPAAEHVMALLLAACKRVAFHDRKMRRGIWARKNLGFVLKGKVLGIIGYGNIGRRVARFAKCFGMRIFAIDKRKIEDNTLEFFGYPDDLDYVLKVSDIILISLPLTKYTYHLIDKSKLRLMKRDAILVNTSRGPIIVEKDLYEHLKQNPNFIVALDVWWSYPKKKENNYQKYPFHELDNVVMTPHIAGFASDYYEPWYRHAIENIKRYINGEQPKNIADREEYIGIRKILSGSPEMP